MLWFNWQNFLRVHRARLCHISCLNSCLKLPFWYYSVFFIVKHWQHKLHPEQLLPTLGLIVWQAMQKKSTMYFLPARYKRLNMRHLKAYSSSMHSHSMRTYTCLMFNRSKRKYSVKLSVFMCVTICSFCRPQMPFNFQMF